MQATTLWRIVAVASFVTALTSLLVRWIPGAPPRDLTVRSMTVVNEAGAPVARLAVPDGVPVLEFLSAEGEWRTRLSAGQTQLAEFRSSSDGQVLRLSASAKGGAVTMVGESSTTTLTAAPTGAQLKVGGSDFSADLTATAERVAATFMGSVSRTELAAGKSASLVIEGPEGRAKATLVASPSDARTSLQSGVDKIEFSATPSAVGVRHTESGQETFWVGQTGDEPPAMRWPGKPKSAGTP